VIGNGWDKQSYDYGVGLVLGIMVVGIRVIRAGVVGRKLKGVCGKGSLLGYCS